MRVNQSLLKNNLVILATMIMAFGFCQQRTIDRFIEHKVKRGEKIEYILTKYNLAIEELYQYNPTIFDRGLKRRMRLKIPVYKIVDKSTVELTTDQTSEQEDLPVEIVFPVIDSKNGEFKGINFGYTGLAEIIQNHSITAEQLMYLNPQLRVNTTAEGNILLDDSQINSSFKQDYKISNVFSQNELNSLIEKTLSKKALFKVNSFLNQNQLLGPLFEVIKLRRQLNLADSLSRDFATTQLEYYKTKKQARLSLESLKQYDFPQQEIDSIESSGIQISIPVYSTNQAHQLAKSEFGSISLLDSIKQRTKVDIALLLPFKTQEYDSLEIDQVKKRLRNTRSLTSISIDFLLGAKLATTTASEFGISVNLKIFNSSKELQKIVGYVENQNQLDAIVGPITVANFNYLSSIKRLSQVPKYFPISLHGVPNRPFVYQTLPDEQTIRKRMIEYLKTTLEADSQNILIISEPLNSQYLSELREFLPTASVIFPSEGNYLDVDQISSKIQLDVPNVVILESESAILVSNTISLLSSIVDENPNISIQLVSPYRGNAYEKEALFREDLEKLKFTFPSRYIPVRDDQYGAFETIFRKKFGQYPNTDAIRGYDLVLDIIIRQALINNGRSQFVDTFPQIYNSHGFKFEESENQSKINTMFFILQYRENNLIELVRDIEQSLW